jgi:hypothetical protein
MTEARPFITRGRESDIVPLPRDATARQREWLSRTAFHPIVHVIVMRAGLVQQRPEIGVELCAAFDSAKRSAYQLLQNERITGLPFMRAYLDDTVVLFGDDPWSYGFQRNKSEIAQFLRYVSEQGFVHAGLSPEDLFEPTAREYEFTARMRPGADLGSLGSLRGFVNPERR